MEYVSTLFSIFSFFVEICMRAVEICMRAVEWNLYACSWNLYACSKYSVDFLKFLIFCKNHIEITDTDTDTDTDTNPTRNTEKQPDTLKNHQLHWIPTSYLSDSPGYLSDSPSYFWKFLLIIRLDCIKFCNSMSRQLVLIIINMIAGSITTIVLKNNRVVHLVFTIHCSMHLFQVLKFSYSIEDFNWL